MVVADLDHFKRVNDSTGTTAGTRCSQPCPHEIRKALRSFELIIDCAARSSSSCSRASGSPKGVEVASRLRAAIEAARPGGLQRTVSLGVALHRGRRAAA